MNYFKKHYHKIQTIGKIIYWLFVCVVLVFGLLAFISTTSVFNGFQLFSVGSGSMEPAISTGSLVALYPKKDYKVGDVITYSTTGSDSKVTTTHRIIEIVPADDFIFFKTKGDANSTPDSDLINKDLVLGKVVFHIPYFGYLVSYIRTVNGVVFFIIIPSVLIVYDEINKLKVEIKKVLSKNNENKIY